MRTALRWVVIALTLLLVIFAAFDAAGIGMYAAALALWPLLLVWRPWLLAGAVAAVVLGALWLWWWLPKRQMRSITAADPKDRADIEDNFRKTIGQLLGGAAVLIGAGFAYLQFTQQQETAREQLRASVQQIDQQQRNAHDLLISNQVAKGFELLGNKDKEMMERLGGIYALEGVMNNSKDYYRPVLEALCAFVRDGTRNETSTRTKTRARTKTGDEPPATDIQAALTVIGRRTEIGTGGVDLANAHIPNADLTRAHLDYANLEGANLNDAYLNGAHLEGAYLIGAHLSAFLNDAHLNGAILVFATLTGALLNGAHLESADLRGAHLERADLRGANLNGATMDGADLSDAKYLTQEQLDKACGTGVKGLDKLSPPLTIKPCS